MARIPIENMTLEEKLAAMEVLWEDLCQQPEDVPSPSWHGELLAEREAALARGEISTVDWDMAKQMIRDRIR